MPTILPCSFYINYHQQLNGTTTSPQWLKYPAGGGRFNQGVDQGGLPHHPGGIPRKLDRGVIVRRVR